MKTWTIIMVLLAGFALSAGQAGPSGCLEEKISIDNPQTLFTAFAYITIGLFEQVDSERMIPLKQFVWQELDNTLSKGEKKRIRKLCNQLQNQMFEYDLTMLAVNCSEPPAIRWRRAEMTAWYLRHDQDPVKKLGQIERVAVILPDLNWFYKKADIPALWRRVQPWYRDAVSQYEQSVFSAIRSALAYLQIAEADFSRKVEQIRVIPNLIGPRGSAMGPIWCGVKYDVYTPWDRISYSPHEFIHDMVAPQTRAEAYAEQIVKIVDLVWEKAEVAAARQHYPDKVMFFDECLVRTLDHWVTLKEKTEVDRAQTRVRLGYHEKRGFVLCPAMLEALRGYEASGRSFAQFFPQFLSSLLENM